MASNSLTASGPEHASPVPGPATPSRAHRHGFWTKFFYGAGSVAYGVKDNGFSVFLLIYYNQVLGLPAARAGLALMLALVIDSVMDPVVGHLSDNLHSRWGRRHPFMYAAAVPTSLAFLFLWFPPAGLSPNGLFAYLVVMAVLVRSLITCYEIPSSALVAELTQDYDERTSYLSFRYFFGWWGGLTMSLLAFKVFLQPTAGYPIGQLNPLGYHSYGVAAAVVMFLSIVVSAGGTHGAIPQLRAAPRRRRPGVAQSAREILQTVGDPSALALLGSGTLMAATAGVVYSLSTYLSTYFWLLKPDQIAILVVPNYIAAALALIGAPPLSRRFGKKAAAIGVSLLAIILTPVPVLMKLAGVLAGPALSVLVPILFAHLVVTTALFIITPILVSAMVADVVEHNELKTGRRTEGVLFAANAFLAKCVTGLGIFMSSAILQFAGFPAKATPGQVPDDVLRRLALTYSAVVALLYLGAVACLLFYRISRERHAATLRALEAGAGLPADAVAAAPIARSSQSAPS